MDELFTLYPDHVFLRGQALDRGYNDRDLINAVRDGVLSKVRHGAYVPASVWQAADALERYKLRGHAVVRSHDSPLALSHTSGAVEHGLRLHHPDLSKVHVTCLGKPIGRTTHDIAYHRPPKRSTASEHTTELGGIPVVQVVQAALEAASMTSVAKGLVILDSVVDLKKGTLDEIHVGYATFKGPGSRRLQVSVRLVREGANSLAETLSRHMMFSCHVPEPKLQFQVYDEHGYLVGRTDFAWPEHGVLGEFDGMGKYLRTRRPDETIEEAMVREKKREDRLRELTGWLMVRLVWADLKQPVHTCDRIRRQLTRGQGLLAS